MIKEHTLNIITGSVLVLMMAFICWKLADQFSLESVYPQPNPTRYTDASYESLEYQNAQNTYKLRKAEQFIQSIADGNL